MCSSHLMNCLQSEYFDIIKRKMEETENKEFLKFIEQNQFLGGYKGKKDEQVKSRKKATKESKKQAGFNEELNKYVIHFDTTVKKKRGSMFMEKKEYSDEEEKSEKNKKNDEFNEYEVTKNFTKTSREQELKQQKRMLAYHQRIHFLQREIKEQRKQNVELFKEYKQLKKSAEENQSEKKKFQEYKKKMEKKLEQMKKDQEESHQIVKQLKPLMSLSVEELDKKALSIAKKQLQEKK